MHRNDGLLMALILGAGLSATTRARAADCAWTEVTGRIEDVHADATNVAVVTRASGERLPAALFLLLCDGDRLELTGTATVSAVVNGQEQTFTAKSGDRVLRGGSQTTFHAAEAPGFFAKLSAIAHAVLTTPQRAIPVYLSARGGSQVDTTPRADPLLPIGDQYLPKGYRKIALIWRGGTGTLDVTAASQPVFHPGTDHHAYAVFDAPQDPVGFRVALSGQPLTWSVKYAASPPSPLGVDGGSIRSSADRLARALWILDGGPSQWRAFALSEIAALADSGNFVAGELWQAARTGTLSDAIARTEGSSP